MATFFLITKIFIALLSVFLSSVALTWYVYDYAVKRGLLSHPNERSSHTVPTPGIGGITIAVLFLIVIAILWAIGMIPQPLALALFGGGFLLAFVGLIDARKPIKAVYRILLQALAAGWAIWWLGGMPHTHLGFTILDWGSVGYAVAFLGILALCNLYNFMDGIDGLVGVETIAVSVSMGAIMAVFGNLGLTAALWALAAATAGFLLWNWHPAKLFMGDVGSVLIGYSFAVFAVFTENTQLVPSLVWVLMLMVVLVDAGASTVIRALRGQRWFEAHRTFGYHAAVARGLSHAQVSIAVLALNIPLAILVALTIWKPIVLLPAVIVALLSYAVLWRRVHRSAFPKTHA